jgi:hypothetical protein
LIIRKCELKEFCFLFFPDAFLIQFAISLLIRSSANIKRSLIRRLSGCSSVCLSVCLYDCPAVKKILKQYWCNFIQTLHEWSVPSLVVHIIVFRLNDVWVMALYDLSFFKFVRTTPLKLLKQFQWNFTGLVCLKDFGRVMALE